MSTAGPSATGMWPIDPFAPEPAVPHSERIFAASRELHEAYARGDEWTKDVPLHEAAVLLVMETVDNSILALIDKWRDAGMPGAYPSVLEAHNELVRIASSEVKQEYETARLKEVE